MRTKLSILCAVALAACGSDATKHAQPDSAVPRPDSTATPPGGDGAVAVTNVDVNADLTGDTTWSKDHSYTLKKHIFVTGGTLTIEPGVRVLGEAGSSLVVTREAKIHAVGTAAAPIVFTSAKPAGQRARGDWGGLVLLGKATINVTGGEEKIEGFAASQTGTVYGGTSDGHDCGKLRYVRIEFAGFELAPDNELNGLTVGGCGSATEIDYVQAHMGADDGVEMFGGTASLKHILITQPDDDGLDWDFGWRGKVQFLIVQQTTTHGNYGIEADSNKNNNDATPRSAPELWNVSLLGSSAAPGTAGKLQGGILFRRGTAGKLTNSLIAFFADDAADVADAATAAQAKSGALAITKSVFHLNAKLAGSWPAEAKDNDGGFDESAHFTASATGNRYADPQLVSPFALGTPSFMPQPGSPVLSGGATPPADGFFDTAATFAGAIGTTDWTAGWTAYPES
ncbi:MAG: hypothetical protein ACOY3Y_02800 [Acidobacteriota bacterium]